MTETAEAPPTVEQLLAGNAGLAWMVARKLHRTCPAADLEDLHAAVRVGFVRAARTFDPARGTTFGTYAVRAGYHTGMDFLRQEAGRGFKVPRNGPVVKVLVGSLDGAPPCLDNPDAPADAALVPDHRDRPPDPDAAGRVWEVLRRHLTRRQWAAVVWVYRDGKALPVRPGGPPRPGGAAVTDGRGRGA